MYIFMYIYMYIYIYIFICIQPNPIHLQGVIYSVAKNRLRNLRKIARSNLDDESPAAMAAWALFLSHINIFPTVGSQLVYRIASTVDFNLRYIGIIINRVALALFNVCMSDWLTDCMYEYTSDHIYTYIFNRQLLAGGFTTKITKRIRD